MATQIDLGKVVPEKGIDYFTQADKTEIQTAVETNIAPELAEKELKANLTHTIDEDSTNEQYPDAQAVYNKLVEQDEKIAELEEQNAMLLDQIPTATATGETINVQDSSNLPLKDFAMLGNATQDGTPTPDTPQDIHVVTGDNTVKVLGKNLFNVGNGSVSWGTVNLKMENNIFKITVGTGSGGISQQVITPYTNYNFDTSKTYKFSLKKKSGNLQFKSTTVFLRARIVIKYSDGTISGGNVNNADINSSNLEPSITVSFTQGKTPIGFAFGVYEPGSLSTNQEAEYYVQLECNSTATPYEPYTEQTQLISLGSIELAKIGDYTDRIFKAVSSNNPLKPSYYDTLPSEVKASLTVGSWYKQGNIGKVTLNGSETWATWNNINDDIGFYSYINTALGGNVENNYNGRALMNLFSEAQTQTSIRDGNAEGMKMCGPYSTSIYLAIGIAKTRLSDYSTQDNAVASFKTWLSTNTPILYYILKEPTTTEITDTTLIAQLENVLKMHTNKNVTNAWIEPTGTNAQAGLTLMYYQDLETLLNDYETRIELLETG